jgi:hypothetical protein
MGAVKWSDKDRTNFEIYPSAKLALEAAKKEAERTGIPQYFVRRQGGFIVTPEAPDDPLSVPVVPDKLNMRGKH